MQRSEFVGPAVKEVPNVSKSTTKNKCEATRAEPELKGPQSQVEGEPKRTRCASSWRSDSETSDIAFEKKNGFNFFYLWLRPNVLCVSVTRY